MSQLTCPYCQSPFALSGGTTCGQCGKPVLGVPCPSCSKPTLNIALLARRGLLTCFACHATHTSLPGTPVAADPPPVQVSAVTPRAPKAPTPPEAAEACAALEGALVGLERAAQDRAMLAAPELRTLLARLLETTQELLALDAAMAGGEVTDEWLRERRNLNRIIRACYYPLMPVTTALLPAPVQLWALAVDDAARRWQYARRVWLADACHLAMMPTIPGATPTNADWHDVEGYGGTIAEIVTPGFLLGDEVLRKARVRAG
jgi:hypothetical protein